MANKSDEMRVVRMTVTPEQAQRWLDTCNTWNRSPKEPMIAKLTADIVADRWIVTHQGIAFDSNNNLLDGQNRLYAIVRAGIAVEMNVAFNVPREAMQVVDCGSVRTLVDSALFHSERNASKLHASTAMAMLDPRWGNKKTRQEQIAFMMRHYGAIDWACSLFTKKIPNVNTATMRAVIARASYSEDKDRLAEFAKVMVTGESKTKSDIAAIRLRDKLMSAGTGTQERRIAYKYIAWALRKFLDNDERVNSVRAADAEFFPLPEERQALKLANGKPVHKTAKAVLSAVG